MITFEKNLRIAGLQKNSTVDFPGFLSAVVFFAGCNFRCYYCHNRHILNDPPLISVEDVLDFLSRRAGLLDGLVLSGGEATLQQGLYSFAGSVKALGYRVKLDTNGSRPDVVSAMIRGGLLDFVAVDYKAPFDLYDEVVRDGSAPDGIDGGNPMTKHRREDGNGAREQQIGRETDVFMPLVPDSAKGVRETFELLYGSGIPYEIRITMIPQITERRLVEMAESLPRLKRFALQLYRPVTGDGRLRPVSDRDADRGLPYTPAELDELAAKIRYAQPNVIVR